MLAKFLVSMTALISAAAPSKGVAESDSSLAPIASIEKIAVFPVLYQGERGTKVDPETAKSLDDTWWQVRDELTETGRFVVASRAFLQKADAFQPRGKLSVGDAVILGRYVESHALLTMSLKDRSFTISVASSIDGTMIWTMTVDLHPSVLIREQIAGVSRALVREFIASFPYQAVTTVDALSKRAQFDDGRRKLARLRLAPKSVAVGDKAEWVQVRRDSLGALFQGASKVSVRAEGTVVEVQDQNVVVELNRFDEGFVIIEGALVNLPKEQARLLELSKSKDSATSKAVVSLLAADTASGGASIVPEGKTEEQRRDESGPLATTLSILASLAVILLLAF